MPPSKSWNVAEWTLLSTGRQAPHRTTKMTFPYLAARMSQRVVVSGPGQTKSIIQGTGVGAGVFQLIVIIVAF